MKKGKIKKTITILITTVILTINYLVSVFEPFSERINDKLYQSGSLPSGKISIIEIDEHSLDELGPYNTWTRDNVAEAIEILNTNPDSSPAVIGVDVLYVGNSNADSDAHLAEAAGLLDNVVMGSYLNMDTSLVKTGDGFVLGQAVSLYEEPYDELKEKCAVGYVNGFADSDGVIRHALQTTEISKGNYMKNTSGEPVIASSFANEIYKKYANFAGYNTDLKLPVNKDGFWYVDYTGKPGTYSSSFSLSDLIQGEIPVEYFTGGIVLIGPYAEGLMDSYTTAIDKSRPMYGVEVHANMIEAMLSGRVKNEVPRQIQAIIIALITILLVSLCNRGKLKTALIGCIVTAVSYSALCIVLYKVGQVLDLVYVPLYSLIMLVVSIAVYYVNAILEKRKVEQTFRRYVAPEVVDEITRAGIDSIKLGGDTVDCAILFVDIRGFTTMSESLEPEQVVSILNRYLELTSGSIFKYGGTLDKFIGDATMAIFGAPLPMEDYVYKAVCAAWDMVQSARELSEELFKEFGKSVSFGVGVHCGKAVVGNIGTSRRMDFTAIGDTVNTAARLESNAPKDTVYISDAVVKALGDRIETESVGNLPLKGKKEPLEVFILKAICD